MTDYWVGASRGPLIECRHQVAAAVTDSDGKVVAVAGDEGLVTFWRSAAKAFQLLPLIEDGGSERFPLDAEMLALACGSHNAENFHREVGNRWLKVLCLTEGSLACGGHASLLPELADEMMRQSITPTPLWSNCSGNHAALLGLALLHGWPTEGYERLHHPVQSRVAEVFSQWTGVPLGDLVWGIDGCTAAAVALPLRSMALAYARLGTSIEPAAVQIRQAIISEPQMIAGSQRLDSTLIESFKGELLVKVGADGVFCASLPTLGLGLALKVLDGDMKATGIALVGLLDQLLCRVAPALAARLDVVAEWRNPAILNTRGQRTGEYLTGGELRFL